MTQLRVAVTGAGGFIGAHVAREMAARGMHVIGIGRRQRPADGACDEWAQVDDYSRQTDRLREALRGADAVVHLAAFAHGRRRPAVDPVRTNVQLARAVFEAAVAEGVARFVNMSSIAAVVSRSSMVVNDSTPPGIASRYGLSKREAERYLAEAAPGSGVVVTSLRPPAVYGPGMRGKSATLFRLIARGVPLPIGGIANSRSFLYVGNLAAAVAMVLTSEPVSGSFAVSDSEPLSTPEFARRIGAALGRPARIVTLPRGYIAFVNRLARVAPAIRFPLDAAGVSELQASLSVDSTRFWQTVEGTPPFTMKDGLRLTAAALRAGGATNAS